MGFIEIDENSCTGCGICTLVCPYDAIEVSDKKARYTVDECFLCGHCYAVCPENAVSEGGFLRAGYRFCDSNYLAPGISDTQMVEDLIRSRRSCRNYKQKDVPLELLHRLVDIGTAAPSGTNTQGWQFKILPKREDVAWFGEVVGTYYRNLNSLAEKSLLRLFLRLLGNEGLERYYQKYYQSVKDALCVWDEKGIDRLFHGAPAVIAITGDELGSCPAEDALLAAQNILLAAHTLGLGTCLIGFAVEAAKRSKAVRRALKLRKHECLYAIICIGFPAVNYLRITPRKRVPAEILTAT